MKKKELWILILIAAGALIALVVLNRNAPAESSGTKVAIQHGNTIVQEFDPDVDAIYSVDGDTGGLQVEVKDGRWRVINEKCPNHICASMGWASVDDPIPITCLPNNIIIYPEESEAK